MEPSFINQSPTHQNSSIQIMRASLNVHSEHKFTVAGIKNLFAIMTTIDRSHSGRIVSSNGSFVTDPCDTFRPHLCHGLITKLLRQVWSGVCYELFSILRDKINPEHVLVSQGIPKCDVM